MLPRAIVPELPEGPPTSSAMTPRCSKKLCVFDGTHRPVLLVRPKDHPSYAGPPMEIVLGLFVCASHQRSTTPADLLTDEGWDQIVAQVVTTGRAEPDRETVGLIWQRVVVKERDPFGVTLD